jgi:hypothetical protein
MSSRTIASGFTEFLGVIGSALAVSAATRQYRQPGDADLKRLGIDPNQFHRIRRY